MLYYALKIAVSALLILAISEIAKRHSSFAALIAALPITSIIAMIWLHLEHSPPEQIATLAGQIFWLVIPSLLLFLLLPVLLRQGLGFWFSLAIASSATVLCYLTMLPMLRRLGIEL